MGVPIVNTGIAVISHIGTGIKPQTVVSANGHGFQTNMGDLTHNFILRENTGIVCCVETFLNALVPEKLDEIRGYSKWFRTDGHHSLFKKQPELSEYQG